MNPNAVTPENAEKFVCMECDFKCSKESDFVRHALTRKHKNRTNPKAILTQKNADKVFACNCGKFYKHMSSLCNHKKNCNIQEQIIQPPPTDMSYNIILEIVKQNQEFKELLIEQNKENQKLQQRLLEMASKIGNTNCNNNNKTNNFNLHLFLNEQCKDALNIEEFVNTI